MTEPQHNGMTDAEQPPIPLYMHRLVVTVITSNDQPPDTERIADAIWSCWPLSEDGDVYVTLS